MSNNDEIRKLNRKYFNELPINVEAYIIPAGTKLYRTAPIEGIKNGKLFSGICEYDKNLPKQKQECTDTGRHGVYFGTYLFIALAMAIEYNKDRELGIFETLVDIPVIRGKYSYRLKYPNRYFRNIERDNNGRIIKLNNFITGVNAKNDEELSHFNETIYPIVDFISKNGKHIEYDMGKFSEKLNVDKDGEIFITDDYILNNIKLIKTYKVDVSILKKIVEDNIDNLSPYDFEMYKDALTDKDCSKVKKSGGKRHTKKNIKNIKNTRYTYRK